MFSIIYTFLSHSLGGMISFNRPNSLFVSYFLRNCFSSSKKISDKLAYVRERKRWGEVGGVWGEESLSCAFGKIKRNKYWS